MIINKNDLICELQILINENNKHKIYDVIKGLELARDFIIGYPLSKVKKMKVFRKNEHKRNRK